ncbi:MAG: glutamate 5-kinase [Coriobacteriia bacterium]|nr:glutamate 5-kinase [Coriobacteriia bacterium]MBN2840309.1 glutamate 5-kinase [Coriobacteriia bacterium]
MARHTIVVKVGSSTVTGADGRVDRGYLAALADQVRSLTSDEHSVVVVTSGAIAAGFETLHFAERPTDMPTLQATAAVGQVLLIDAYREIFGERGMTIGQVLVTRHEVGHRQQYVHACETLERLLELGIVPIVNENDTTAVEEIRFGDNDYLAALVGMMVHADLVVLLTDIAGLYSADPRIDADARLLEHVHEVTDEHLASAGGPGSGVGSGGMTTKLEAARALMKAGIPMVVCDGRRPNVVADAVAGAPVGTLFAGGQAAVKGRKLWLAYAGHPRGSVTIDDGAKHALCLRGGSLLPAGVVDVTGSFVIGDAIAVVDGEGHPIARGLAGMSSADLKRVRGLKTAEISRVLPNWDGAEVVHRDHLVIL